MMDGWQPGAVIAGEFTVERDLGSGSFGQVRLVRSRYTGERYAVKRIHLSDPVEQGRMIAEAQRWINLPPFPHITACRFVRTINNALVVFSEYLPGGTLAERIRSRALYQGADCGLHSLVAVAAHTAWGLDAAHAIGMLHLDMKPGNVLFAEDDTAKITDFGIAATADHNPQEVARQREILKYVDGEPARLDDASALLGVAGALDPEQGEALITLLLQGSSEPVPRNSTSIVVAASGRFTEAYVSPEQFARRTVGRGADVWSWAVTVLEMFLGGCHWGRGTIAGATLRRAVRGRLPFAPPLTIPPAVADVLEACLDPDPTQRPSLRRAADTLLEALPQGHGHRPPPQVPFRPTILDSFEPHDPRSGHLPPWGDPGGYLYLAYKAAGLDLAEAEEYWPSRRGSRRSQALADLHAFEQARMVVRDVADRSSDAQYLLARIAIDVANINQALGDMGTVVSELSWAVDALDASPLASAARLLPEVLLSLATVLNDAGRSGDALGACDRSAAAASRLDDPIEAITARAWALLAKAGLMRRNGATAEERLSAAPLYAAAIAAFQSVDAAEGEAKALGGKAALMHQIGRREHANALSAEADAKLAAMVAASGADYLDSARARLMLNWAEVASAPADMLRYSSRAAATYRQLVNERGYTELTAELGRALCLTGYGHERQGDPQGALREFRNGRLALERAVLQEGHAAVVDWLAQCYGFEATLTYQLEGPEQFAVLAHRAADLWQALVDVDGPAAWGVELASARQYLAVALLRTGDAASAAEQLDAATKALERAGSSASPAARRVTALIHRGRGVLHRSNGQLADAYEECATAAAILSDATDPDEVIVRVRAHQTMSAVLADAERHAEAIEVLRSIVVDAEHLVARGAWSREDLLDLNGRLARAYFRTGEATQAAQVAQPLLEEYEQLLAAGRSDLLAEAARIAGVLGMARHWLADLSGAVDALERSLRIFDGLSEDDAPLRRIVREIDLSHIRGESPTDFLPQDDRDEMSPWLRDILPELRRMLAAGPDDVPHLLDEATTKLQSALNLAAAGLTAGASKLLDDLQGNLLWLRGMYPGEAVEELNGDVALNLGVSALNSGRYGAARRGFVQAMECYRALVTERGRGDVARRWFDAHRGLATLLTSAGDSAAAERVLREMREHKVRWAPE